MLDLKFVLKNKALILENSKKRDIKINIEKIEKLAEKRKKSIELLNKKRHNLKILSKKIKSKKLKKEIEKAKTLKQNIKKLEKNLLEIENSLKKELLKIPNLTHPDVPFGRTEKDNRIIKQVKKIKKFKFQPKDHLTLAKNLDLVDFEAGAKTTGTKFYFLKNKAAELELGLINYALSILKKEGFVFFITPDLAKLEIIEGTGFSPRGKESQIYTIENLNLGLIATAEITLLGIYKDKILNEDNLPLKLCGLSHCFRKEAGTYGKASKGLYRVHQFTKLEMFIYSKPEDSEKYLKYLVELEEKITKGLELPYRIVECCTGELGNSAYHKYDIEVWLPGEKRWGEITSASNCTDYQARRLNIKYKDKSGKKYFVHTLNATALAVPRIIISILENHQQKDSSIKIPKKLKKFLDFEKI